MWNHDFEALPDVFDDNLVHSVCKIKLSQVINGNLRRFRSKVLHDRQLPR
jgi:hypothetical protein